MNAVSDALNDFRAALDAAKSPDAVAIRDAWARYAAAKQARDTANAVVARLRRVSARKSTGSGATRWTMNPDVAMSAASVHSAADAASRADVNAHAKAASAAHRRK